MATIRHQRAFANHSDPCLAHRARRSPSQNRTESRRSGVLRNARAVDGSPSVQVSEAEEVARQPDHLGRQDDPEHGVTRRTDEERAPNLGYVLSMFERTHQAPMMALLPGPVGVR